MKMKAIIVLLLGSCQAFQTQGIDGLQRVLRINERPVVATTARKELVRGVEFNPLMAVSRSGNGYHRTKTPWHVFRIWNKSNLQRIRRNLWKFVKMALISMLVVFSLQFSALAAPSAHRTGGSFRSSGARSPSTMGRHSTHRISPSRHYPRPSALKPFPHQSHSYHSYNFWPSGQIRHVYSSPVVIRQFSPADLAVVIGTGGLILYGCLASSVGSNNQGATETLLGKGATATSLTVVLNVPDRKDPSNILKTLENISNRVDTSRREGIQDLIADTSLALLRNERSITSCYCQSQHSTDAEKAQQDFNRQSVEIRSKFDKETVNRFGGEDRGWSSAKSSPQKDSDPLLSATVAVVSLNLAIDGESTHFPVVKNRGDLINALQRIATDARAGDCLFSAEVLFSPGEESESLAKEDLYSMFPNLQLI